MKPTRFESIVLLIAAGVISYYTFIPPLIGLADSGDFGRITLWRGLSHVSTEYDDMYFRYFNSKYRIITAPPGPDWYLTSTSLLVIPARQLSIAAGHDQIFDIRILAALQLLPFLFGIWLILVSTRSLQFRLRLILSCVLIVIFTDVGYTAYFNSFYSEGTALAFLTIAVGCGLILITRQTSSFWLVFGYFLAICMVVTSKPAYVPVAPAFALFGVYLSSYTRLPMRYLIATGLAMASFCLAVQYAKTVKQILTVHTVYIGVFMDLLPNSKTPEEDLVALGIDPYYARYSGTTPYQPDSPLTTDLQFRDEFTKAAKPYTLPLFYLKHPGRLYELCERCVRYAFFTRVFRLGYYEARSGKPPYAKPFGLWSWIRERFPRSLFFVGLFCATGIAAVFSAVRSSSATSKGIYLLYVLLVFTACEQFLVAVTAGGGAPDVEKHLFMFNLCFDACVILWILGIAGWLQQGGWARIRSNSPAVRRLFRTQKRQHS